MKSDTEGHPHLATPWRDHPRLKGKFHPQQPDDLQVIVHDGGPRLTDRQPELIWVRVIGEQQGVFAGTVLNAPTQLLTVEQGDAIHFIIPRAGDNPLMVREKYLHERPKWIIHPCNKCGLSELFDAPSDLIAAAGPGGSKGQAIVMLTVFCAICGGVQIMESANAQTNIGTGPLGRPDLESTSPKRWWQFWKGNTMKIFSALALLLFATAFVKADPAGKFPQWDGRESVANYAQRAKLAPTLTLDLGDGVKWEGVLIPAGTFIMGSAPGEAKRPEEAAIEKQHMVSLSQPFYIGKFELTQPQYQKVTGANPSKTKGDDLPVHNITWQDAADFCQKLSKQSGRDVQLPTEAQWEYACRAGTTTPYYNGSDPAGLDKIAWTGGNSGKKMHPVGQKEPNAWGLYDMIGNAREFVRDLYADLPLPDAADPTGPAAGDPKNHVVRGGAYTANAVAALNCRSATRRPTENIATNGFRIVVSIPAR